MSPARPASSDFTFAKRCWAEELTRFIEVLERACGREAVKVYDDMQPGDVEATYADIEESRRDLGFEPRISIDEGLPRFVAWYRDYHGG